MNRRKVNKSKQTTIYIATIFIALGKFLRKNFFNIANNIANFYKNISNKLTPKVGSVWTWFILILSTIIIVIGIIFGISIIIDAYRDEVYKQYIIQTNIEEEARIEAEKEAQRLEEESRQWVMKKEIEAAYNLKPLGLPYKRLDVPILYQHPELPSACECVALTNMMNYYGFNLAKNYLVDNYLKYDEDDWVNYYVGSPYGEDLGGIMMCPGISHLFDNYIIDHPAPFKGFDVSGKNFENLFAYIERGHPVQIWSSLNMSDLGEATTTTDDGYSVYWYSHSVLITGFDSDEGIVYVADSINGACYYSIDIVKDIYEKQNKQAFVMISQEELDKWIQGQDWSYDNTISKDSDENNEEKD